MRALVLSSAAACLLLASTPTATAAPDADAPGYAEAERPNDFAVVVGVENHKTLRPARFAENDARAVMAHLRALGVASANIKAFLGPEATAQNLREHLEKRLPPLVRADSRVYFYFAGHGSPDQESGKAYLVAWDGDPHLLEETSYSLKELYAALAALKAREVLAAIDASFCGSGERSVLPLGVKPLIRRVDAPRVRGRALVVLSAARTDQAVFVDEGARHGLFTYYLLDGLSGNAADGEGRITARSLHDHLAPMVEDETVAQTPQLAPSPRRAASLILRQLKEPKP